MCPGQTSLFFPISSIIHQSYYKQCIVLIVHNESLHMICCLMISNHFWAIYEEKYFSKCPIHHAESPKNSFLYKPQCIAIKSWQGELRPHRAPRQMPFLWQFWALFQLAWNVRVCSLKWGAPGHCPNDHRLSLTPEPGIYRLVDQRATTELTGPHA